MTHLNTSGGSPRRQHATIITGGTAAQREQAAQKLAAEILCQSSGPRPCGSCSQCRKLAAGIHPDLIRLTPDKGMHKVDAIRAMRTDAFTLPNDAEARVFLIEDADLMNEQAQNAALKILEEPPSHAVFLLVTALPDSLRPTVRSRCATLRLPSAPDAPPPELSQQLVTVLCQRDRLALALLCQKLEKLPREQFLPFLEGGCTLFSQALRAKLTGAPAAGCVSDAVRRLSTKNILAVIRTLEQTARYYENNCGTGPLAGLVNATCWEAIHD